MVLNGYCKIQTSGHVGIQKPLKQTLNLFLNKGEKHVIFQVSRTPPDENKKKVGKPFEIDKIRYLSFTTLLRITAHVNRFINYIRNKQK